jgi:hypothetical protein
MDIGTRHVSASLGAIGVIGCALALAAGAAAGTGRGPAATGTLVALAGCGFATALFVRDPVRVLIGVWIIVVLNTPLSILAGYDSSLGQTIRQADELVVLFLLALTTWRAFRTGARVPLRFLLPGVLVGLFGTLGAALHHVPLTIAAPGAWLGLKLWASVAIALLLPWQPADLQRVYRTVTVAGVLVAMLGLVEFATGGAATRALHLQAIPVGAANYRPDAVHSIFYHPGEYSVFMSVLFAFAFARFAATRSRSDLALALLFAASVVLSLRLKGVLSLVAVVAIVALAQGAVRRRRSVAVSLVGLLLTIGVYSVESDVISRQLSYYTSSESSARAQLYETGVNIGADNAPLGVGFGRFASYPSVLHYSPVYDRYGLSSIDGLSRLNTYYIEDVSWPSVLGEAGYAGLAAYLAGVAVLLAALGRRLRALPDAAKWAPVAALCTLVVILVDSLGGPTLFSWVPTLSFAIIFGPVMVASFREERTAGGQAPGGG